MDGKAEKRAESKEIDESEDNDENLRDLILEQLSNLEQSDVSDDGSYKVRLSCILEDDESETSSGAFQKDGKKASEKGKESGKGPPLTSGIRLSGAYDSETSDDVEPETVRVTDLDDETLVDAIIEEKAEDRGDGSEESDDVGVKPDAYQIKKLKSSDNLHKRPFVTRRRELSSDSSDLDISVTNSADGTSSEVKITEVAEASEEDDAEDMKTTREVPRISTSDTKQKGGSTKEADSSADNETEPKTKSDVEVLDNETLSSIFAKVSKTYLEKMMGPVKWEETERVDRPITPVSGDHQTLQDAHIRGTLSKEYNPPIPPETYLWEELKRLRERGGYPWTYLDKPPFDEATWKKYMEHVYEPINPHPPSSEQIPSREELTEAAASSSKGPSIPETCRHKTPEHESLKKQQKSADETHTIEDMEVEMISMAQEMQPKTEESHSEAQKTKTPIPATVSLGAETIAVPPSTTPATTVSPLKSIMKNTTTKLMKDLPIKHTPLGKTRREQMRAQAHDIQEKFRNQAGRIRTKVNNIRQNSLRRKKKPEAEEPATSKGPKFKLPEVHAPKITMPDRSKFKLPEKAKLHLPDASKFHLPERSKFNLAAKIHLPEKGKFHMPERPKLHLPEKARLHLPDRSKLRLPERPRIHLPDRSKLRLPDRSKLRLPDRAKLHFPEGGKWHLPDRSKFHLPEGAKLHLPDRAKFHLPERPKFHLPDKSKFHLPERAKMIRPKLDISKFGRTKDAPMSPVSSINPFELKSYPKLFSKHSKEYTTSSPKQTRGRTPPPRMLELETSAHQKASTSDDRWKQKLEDDIQYADDDDEDAEEDIRETGYQKDESLFDYGKKDTEFIQDYGKETRRATMADRIADNIVECEKAKRKKGVLEEINSDEYFLRQKGISQDDIEMGNYLSREIREAFRSSGVNALAKMDYVDSENVDPNFQDEPVRPARTGSMKKKKKSILKKPYTSDPSLTDDGYKTYPPRRPGRKSRSQSKSLVNEDEAAISESIVQHPEKEENQDVNLSRYDNVEYEDDEISEYYKSPGPAKEYEHYKVPRYHGLTEAMIHPEFSLENEFQEEHKSAWNETSNVAPIPMVRKKNRKLKKKSEEVVESRPDEKIPQQALRDLEEDISLIHESPVPPKRTRSSGSKSFVTEEEMSFQSELDKDYVEDEILTENIQPVSQCSFTHSEPDFVPEGAIRCEITDLDDVGFGYATVGKPSAMKPQRQKKDKPERPPPPRKKKEISVPVYNTYPRKAPIRPLRNYSTLGPARPPRRSRLTSKSQTAVSSKPFSTYSEIDGGSPHDSIEHFEVTESTKDLQTEKVFEKMKGRPLPPPPRPPRQKSKGPEDTEPTEEERISLAILRDEEFPVGRPITAFADEPVAEKEVVQEICAFTQTDAPAEDFSLEPDDEHDDTALHEFGRQQLKIQQAFLDEIKKEEELRRMDADNDEDLEDVKFKAEVIRQMEDIIAEEKRILEEDKKEESLSTSPHLLEVKNMRDDSAVGSVDGRPESSKTTERGQSDPDVDMGYASLDRRGLRSQEPPARETPPPALPPKMAKLHVKELEAETISVHEVQANQIFVKEMQSNRVASQDIDNTGGNIVLGNVDLSPAIIDQIVAKIPWDTIRESQERNLSKPSPSQDGAWLGPPVRPQRRHRRASPHPDDSDDEMISQPPRSGHRRHQRHRRMSDDEESWEKRPTRGVKDSDSSPGTIPELSIRLVRACTAAGVDTVRNFFETNAAFVRSFDREMCVQAILCIAVALVAAFFLFGYDAKIIHMNRWDFQFPPQPPNPGLH